MVKKIEKTDIEWKMFVDFWQMYQKLYIPEDNDTYWELVISEVNEFAKKYNTQFAKDLALAVSEELERKYKLQIANCSRKR